MKKRNGKIVNRESHVWNKSEMSIGACTNHKVKGLYRPGDSCLRPSSHSFNKLLVLNLDPAKFHPFPAETSIKTRRAHARENK